MGRNQTKALILIISTYILCGIAFALVTPPLESSDEYKHYPVVQYIQTHHALPVLDPANPGRWLQEGVQPPLYYIFAAAITSWIDTSDLAEIHQVNPHTFVGNVQQLTNKNLIIHRPEKEVFPWQGTILAIYIIRLASLGLGAATILLTAKLGQLLFTSRIGLFAAALTAFNPMFLFVSAAVNNDALAIFLGHLGLYLLVKLLRDAPDPHKQLLRYVELGLVLGLGMLTKLSLGALLGLAGIALARLSWKHRNWRLLFLGGTVTLFFALTISGWWFVRNLHTYGDLTGLNTFIKVQGARDTAMTWQDWVAEFGTFYRTCWGLFGGVNVGAPEFFYWGCNFLTLLGVAGLALWLRQNPQAFQSYLWLLAAWAASLFLLLVRWNSINPAFQGRLIFPALGALNILWVLGLTTLAKLGQRPVLTWITTLWMVGAAIILPWSTIRPAYAFPEPLETVSKSAEFGPISFTSADGLIELVGIEISPQQTVAPAENPVEVTLYWKAVRPVKNNYVSSIHLLGRDFTSIGQVNRYPAWGMIPTSQWETGQIWRDSYRIYVDDKAYESTRLRISVSLFDTESDQLLPASGPDGAPLQMVIVGEAKLQGTNKEKIPQQLIQASFGDQIRLVGYDLELNSETITLHWIATENLSENYTVFIHVLDQTGALIGQGDGPPVHDDYPTSYWEPGEIVVDKHILEFESGASKPYQLAIGLYRPADGTRLPVWDANEIPLPDNRILLPIDP